jgi:phytol kinase
MSPNLEHCCLLLVVSVLAIGLLHWVAARGGAEPETKRKALHLGAGTIGLTAPWLFDRAWPVFVLCGVLLIGLAVVRWQPKLRSKFGGDLYGVRRRSIGELLFPVAIAALFWLSDGNKVLYVVPLLIVTTADGAAALAASRYGLSPYPTIRGKKTWEGTFIFLCVAFLVTVISLLLLSDVGRADVLLIGCLIGLIGCIIEATTWSGLDNLIIPLGTYFALKRFLGMTTSALVAELAVVMLMMIIAVAWTRRTRLTTQANLCAVLVAFVLWSVGGTAWIATALAAFLLHPLLTHLPIQTPATVDLRAVLSVSSCSVVWMAIYRMNLLDLDTSLYAGSVGLVTHLCMISLVRRREVAGAKISWWSHSLWAALASTVVTGCYLVSVDSGRILLVVAAAALAALTSILFAKLPVQPDSGRRWTIQALCALLASCAGFVVQQLPTLLQDATDSPPQTSSLHQSFIESRLATADRPVVAFCMRKDDPFPEDTGNRSDHVFGFSITAVPSRTQIR